MINWTVVDTSDARPLTVLLIVISFPSPTHCLQCFDTVGWVAGTASGLYCKNWVVMCWHGYLSIVRCRLAYSPADSTATHCLLLQQKIQIGFTFLVPAHLGSPGQRAIKQGVCVCSIIHSLFHSRLKTFLFCKSFPPQPFLFFFRTDCMDSGDFCWYFWAYRFLLFSYSVLHFLVVLSVQ